MIKTLLTIVLLFSGYALIAQCPDSDVILRSQENVDSFKLYYPDCSEFDKSIIVSSAEGDVTNLNGLSKLTTVGNLTIGQNNELRDLTGLENLEKIEGTFQIWSNDSLSSLNGCQNLASIDELEISENFKLNSLEGLDALRSLQRLELSSSATVFELTGKGDTRDLRSIIIKGDIDLMGIGPIDSLDLLSVESSNLITSIDYITTYLDANIDIITVKSQDSFSLTGALSFVRPMKLNFQSLGYLDLSGISGFDYPIELTIFSCPGLNSLEKLSTVDIRELWLANNPGIIGLNDLQNIERLTSVQLVGNENLIDISALDQVDTLYQLFLSRNESLHSCAYSPICNKVEGDQKDMGIKDNGLGCESIDTVAAQCLRTSSTDVARSGVNIYPVPGESHLTIETDLDVRFYSITTCYGQVLTTNPFYSDVIDISHLISGTYILNLILENQHISMLFVKN